jgi:hypothetical protein
MNQARASSAMEKDLERLTVSVLSMWIQSTLKVLGHHLYMSRENPSSARILQILVLSQIRVLQLLLGHQVTTTAISGSVNRNRITVEQFDSAYANYVLNADRVAQMYRWRY